MSNNNKMIPVDEVYLNADPESGHMVILKEHADAKRYFMMFVGEAEFSAIAKEKGLMRPKRPLTHDLYLHILEKLQVKFMRIEISHMKEDTFYANVIFSSGDQEYGIDSRPSDAVALALNRRIPIMVNETLFRKELTQDEIKEYEGIVKMVKF